MVLKPTTAVIPRAIPPIGDYGGNPLDHANTGSRARPPPLAGYLQHGLYRPPRTNGIANPAPLDLVGFAFTTLLLPIIN